MYFRTGSEDSLSLLGEEEASPELVETDGGKEAGSGSGLGEKRGESMKLRSGEGT